MSDKNISRLKKLISMSAGKSWDDKVCLFAVENGRSRSSIYRWITSGPPPNVLDAIDYRLTRTLTE